MIKKRGALFYVDARRYAGAQRRFTTKEEAEGYLEQVRSAHVAGSVWQPFFRVSACGRAAEIGPRAVTAALAESM